MRADTPLTASATSAPKAGSASSAAPKVALVDLARLAEAIWHMLTCNRPFAPAGAAPAPMTAMTVP